MMAHSSKQLSVRRKLSLEFMDVGDKDENVTQSDKKNMDIRSTYKLRETPKKKYFDDEDDTEDYSPDGSEYVPSPDRTITAISPSTSSFGGDSQVIDNILLNDEMNITRTPSTVSNLSMILNTDSASPSISHKADHNIFSTPKNTKRQKQIPLVDITLKSQQTLQMSDIEVEEELEQTLTSNKTDDSTVDSMIDTINLQLPSTKNKGMEQENNLSILEPQLPEEKEKKIIEENKTDYVIYNYEIIVDIEPKFPNADENNAVEPISDKTNPQKSASDSLSTKKDSLVHIHKNNTVQYQIPVFQTDVDKIDNIQQQENQIQSPTALNLSTNVTVHEVEPDQPERPTTPLRTTKNTDEQNPNNSFKNTCQEVDVAEAECNNTDDHVPLNYVQIQTEEKIISDSEQNDANEEENLSENIDPIDVSNELAVNEPEISRSNGVQDGLERPKTPSEVFLLDAAAYADSENNESTYASDSENRDPSTSKKLTRKRKRDCRNWKDSKNKLLKNSGEAYEGARTKKKYEKKTIGPSCVCSKECGLKFDEEQRQAIYKKFYKLGSREQQWLFILRHVKGEDIKRVTLGRKNNRTQTIKYNLPLNGEEIQVCKIFFLHTLSITESMVYTALEKNKNDDSFTDNRGKHLNRPHKMKPATEASIIRHINMFPKVESHYIRKESKREYLSELLNISKMYRLYKEWFMEQNYTDDVIMASKRQYETIFNTKYNYSFFQPKKDQCTLCAKYKQAESNEKSLMEEKYRMHLKRKEKIRDIKKKEKKESDKKNTVVAIFDLEKVLNVPQSEVSIFHYKRKYPVYNFTIFDALNKQGYCYVWHAQIGKKGCTEIGSCLLNFMRETRKKGISKMIFYSDGCYGQNKNRYIFALYVYAAKTLQLDITHRFFVGGHSQNEGDSMHSCIERNLKKKVIYTPEQIYGIILNAKVEGNKYALYEMTQSEFLDIKKLVVPKKWQQDKNGEKVRWSEVMEVSVSHENPNCFHFRYDFDEEYSELDINPQVTVRNKKRRGRPPVLQEVQLIDDNAELKPAYNTPLPINKALHKDLQSLCSSGAIPRYYHDFYQSLVYDDNTAGGDENNDCDSDESSN